MSPTPSSEVLRAWRLMLEARQLLAGRLDRDLLEHHQIRLPWYDVLLQLNEAGGRLRMHALADATLFSRADCTRLVDRMERHGLVRREADAIDRRGVNAVLTPAGKATLRRAAVTHLDGIEEYFGSRLTPRQASGMAAALARVVEGGAR